MSIRLLVDMNLSPDWVAELGRHGFDAIHWSAIGDPRSSDQSIMAWARHNGYTVFTHDLDFGSIRALTHADGPSVLQVRGQNIFPQHLSALVIAALCRYEAELSTGAILIIEEMKCRVRVLPI